MGALMRNQIDAFIEAQGTGSEALRAARDLNTRVSKMRALDNLDVSAEERAASTGSGGNADNAARQNVRRFKDKTKNLTPAEQDAARRVIMGSPGQNALRLVGKLSPEGGMLSLGGNLLTAGATGGKSLVISGAGMVAKRAADAITERNVKALRDLIATGGEAAREVSRQLADPQYAELRAQLANDLSVAAGVQGSGRRGSVTAYVEGHPEYGVGVSRK